MLECRAPRQPGHEFSVRQPSTRLTLPEFPALPFCYLHLFIEPAPKMHSIIPGKAWQTRQHGNVGHQVDDNPLRTSSSEGHRN